MPAVQNRKRRQSPKGPGFTIPKFAQEVDQSDQVIRAAVKNGLIDAVLFNGIRRIPPRELAKWRNIWGEPNSSAAE